MLCFIKSLIVRVPFRMGVKLCVTQPECTHNAGPLFLPFSLENVASEWQYCWMLLLLAAAYVGMLSHSFGPSLPCALQQCWSQWIKTFRGETRSNCQELFALLLFRAGWLKKTQMPIAILKHISPFSEFHFSGCKMCSVMEKNNCKACCCIDRPGPELGTAEGFLIPIRK